MKASHCPSTAEHRSWGEHRHTAGSAHCLHPAATLHHAPEELWSTSLVCCPCLGAASPAGNSPHLLGFIPRSGCFGFVFHKIAHIKTVCLISWFKSSSLQEKELLVSGVSELQLWQLKSHLQCNAILGTSTSMTAKKHGELFPHSHTVLRVLITHLVKKHF